MPHRTFGLREAAEYLHLPPEEMERLVRNQEIPFERYGGRIVFRKLHIDSWASPRIMGLDSRRLSDYHHSSSLRVREILPGEAVLPDLIRPEFVAPALQAKTKASVLREMVTLAQRTGRVWDAKELLAGLLQREDLCSTGLPGGVALLHTRAPDAYLFEVPFLLLGKTVQAVPFGATDGRPTDLFFLIACPDTRLHLHLLARLCLLAQKTDVLPELREAGTANEMHDCLISAESLVVARRH